MEFKWKSLFIVNIVMNKYIHRSVDVLQKRRIDKVVPVYNFVYKQVTTFKCG